jgi:trans-aconitate 3-methyltransferase
MSAVRDRTQTIDAPYFMNFFGRLGYVILLMKDNTVPACKYFSCIACIEPKSSHPVSVIVNFKHRPAMSPSAVDQASAKELGFSASQGANWSNYLVYRPLYPASFFDRIYDYHSAKATAAWATAHDVGAGCGVVSATLASRFDKVVVSDPNDGYVTLARKALVEESRIPESKLKFLQEGAEKTSVNSGTVDLITACECIQWTDTDAAIREFGRQLRPGGTLLVSYYTVPRIAANEAAQRIWRKVWAAYSERALGALFDHAFPIINTGLETVGFPDSGWESVTRTYINSLGTVQPFKINDRVGKSRVKPEEERIWVDGDQDWTDVQGIDWFKGYFGTWVPRIPESELQDIWDELELSLQGKKVKIETPIVLILATKSKEQLL